MYTLIGVKIIIYYIDIHECFTGKQTTHKIHMKLHPGPQYVFSITSLMRILRISFSAFACVFIFELIYVFCILYNKKKIICGGQNNMNFIFSCTCNARPYSTCGNHLSAEQNLLYKIMWKYSEYINYIIWKYYSTL